MLKSYFFVPANKERFLNKVELIEADEIILDLEDTVPLQELPNSIESISSNSTFKNYFVRPNIFIDNKFDLSTLKILLNKGFTRFVIPKIESVNQIEKVLSLVKNADLVLLVEHPRLYIELKRILELYSNRFIGIGLGAHDFSMNTNHIQYDIFINQLRIDISILAAAFKLESIDTASMIISDEPSFKMDCINAFNAGCSGKFLIHPQQLDTLKAAEYFKKEEIEWAKKAIKVLDTAKESELSAISIDGKVLERPHLKRIKLIKEYLQI